MTRDTKIILGVVGGLFTLGCLITVGLVVVMGSALDSFGGDGQWNSFSIPQSTAPSMFGVTIPSGVMHYEVREQGFQDAMYEAVMELPPGTAEQFLEANHLERDGVGHVPDDVLKEIRVSAGAVTLTQTALEVPEPDQDAGTAIDGRSAVLLEGEGGVVWLYLQAFET